MRKKALLGVGLALFTGSAGTAQFASERPVGAPAGLPAAAPRAQPATLPPGLSPVGPGSAAPQPGRSPFAPAPVVPAGGAYVPPTSGVQPATYNTIPRPEPLPTNLEIKTALEPNHEWRIKPEHGAFFIMVKSYVRPAKGSKDAVEDKGLSARELAEGLAGEIREQYKVGAWLFEYVSEERKAEMRQIAAARQKAAIYAEQLKVFQQKSQVQNMEFLAPDNKLHIMTHNHRDQIGVLVGGFQTEADALKALVKLKTWPTPKNEVLLDKGLILSTVEGKQVAESAAINPYATAFVVPNPSVPRAAGPQGPRKLDPFIVKLNEGQPYNLLKATKGWTLAVKSFTSPVEIVNKNSDPSVMRKMGFSKGTDVLAAGAEQAESMAKALRSMKGPAGVDGRGGQPLNLEAFVLHTRSASLVTVGQFDGPDDPALVAVKRVLVAMTVKVTEDQHGSRPAMNAPALFDDIIAMPIPKRD
ncbi:hypothetical protein J8F10_35945 [Gemmata sp. G18]|uniref:SPOR domain-containing protein n=1 Tax=Gemmata palustris TaxID=2822762 RepID=A0ABS5C427_9BACT|nr:hypothetical protein [Gemmata palustris]MBP3960648.1 hypothetical protein [Gemmata palustris]